MAKRYFNWKLAIVLLIGIAVLSVTAFGLRQWQRNTRAERALALGNEAYAEHKWDEAARELGRHLSIEQDDVPILLKYADAQLKRRPVKRSNIQQAIAAYRTVLRIDKNNSEASTRLTEVYLNVGTPSEAELIARRYLETNDEPELRQMLAVALARQRKFQEAVSELKSLIADHPDYILAYETLGQFAEQRPEEIPGPVESWFDEAVDKNPASALAYIVRAGFHLRNKDKSKALADLQEAEKQDLSDPVVRLHMAKQYINADILDKADKHLELVRDITPDDQALWRTWAELALRSRSPEKMREIAEAGLEELSSEPWDFMPIAAELFIRAGELDKAMECISRMAQKDINLDTVAFLRGLIAHEKGHIYEAISHWSQATHLGTESSRARMALASAYADLGNTQSALRQLHVLVSESPSSLSGHLALARLTAQIGNWSESAEYAAKARQLSPTNLDAALLDIQARIHLLASQSGVEVNIREWQDVDKQLQALDKTTGGEFEVKILQVQVAMLKRDLSAAKVLLEELKKTHHSRVRVVLLEAELLAAERQDNEAIALLQGAVKEFPKETGPVRYLAFLFVAQSRYEKAEEVLQAGLSRINQPAAQRNLGLLLAQIYMRSGQKDKAYHFVESLAQKLTNDILVKRRLLAFEQISESPERAQRIIDDIKALEGEDGWQWRYEQAKVWFGEDEFTTRYPKIVSLLQKNLLANPDDQASRVLLGATYERSGELQLAISTYREALSRSPDDIRIIVPTVALLYKAEEYNEAEEILNRAAQQDLHHPQLQQMQLQSYLRRGEFSPASDILQDLLSNDPNNQSVCLSLALLKMRQGEFAAAGELLDQLQTQEPNSLPVISAAVQLNIRQGKVEEALKLCDRIVSDAKNASAYILRAKTFATLGHTDRAIEDFNKAIAIEPNNVESLVERSNFFRSTGQMAKSLADIKLALSLSPDNIQLQKRIISLLLASKNSDDVQQGKNMLKAALESNPDDIDLRIFKANSLLAEGTAPAIDSAQQMLQKMVQDYPKASEAWVLLGDILLQQRQPGRAIDIALRGLAYRPNNKALLLLKARAEAMRSPILSVPTLRVLQELDPNDIDIAVHLANAYIAAGETEKAVNLLREQLNVCDASTAQTCRTALAVALYKSGEKEEAKKEFNSLFQAAPNDPDLLLTQARLLEEDKLWDRLVQRVFEWYQQNPADSQTLITIAGNLGANEDPQAKKKAEDILRKILDRHPKSLEALSTLAIVLQMAGRGEESVEFYQQVLELDPGNVVAINNLAWVLCEEQGKCQEALNLAQKGFQISPPNYVDLIDTRGVIYYRLGELDKAAIDLRRCVALLPQTTPPKVVSRFHLARVLAQLGQKNEAIEQLREALDLQRQVGGLTPVELTEAQQLLEQLQKGT